jgi:hypothetical protein
LEISSTQPLLEAREWIANLALFCRGNGVRYSDFVRYSDVKEVAIEIPRVFAEKERIACNP